MTDSNEFGFDRPQDDLPPSYRAAVDAILAEPVPDIELARLVSLRPMPARIAPNRRRPWLKIIVGSTLAAAAILALAFVWLNQSGHDAWADVVRTVQAMPWVHFKSVGAQNRVNESWFSHPERIMATRFGEMFVYEDMAHGFRDEFDPGASSVTRLPAGDNSAADLEAFSKLFFGGAAPVGEKIAGLQVVQQKSRSVPDRDGDWDELELKLAHGGQSITMTLRIDPKDKLPRWVEIKYADVVKIHSDIDYPEKGPTDIYALGVPKNVPTIDRIPSQELETVLAKLKESFHAFGDYTAIVSHAHGIPERILRFKGDKWRMDLCLATDRVEKLTQSEKQLIDDTSQTSWWNNRLKQFDLQPALICDGKEVYRYGTDLFGKATPGVWNALRRPLGRWEAVSTNDTRNFAVEILVYPPIQPSYNFETSLRSAGKDEPAGTVVVENKGVGPSGSRMYDHGQYWLDPQLGYAVVKAEFLGCIKLNNPSQIDPYRDLDQTNIVRVFEDFRRTPKGLWYPTVVRWKNAVSQENADGKKELRDLVTYFHLDFDTGMPDDLFDPQKQ